MKNIFVSGCLIYPLANTCFEKIYWTDKETAKYISKENEAWAKNWPDSKLGLNHKEYIKKFIWFNDWKKNYLPKLIKTIAPYILTLLFLSFYFSLTKRKSNVIIPSRIYLLFIPMGISLLLWFLKFPILRYGQAFMISFFALGFAFFISKYSINDSRKNFFYIMIFICFFIFTSKNLYRMYKTPNDYFNYPWPKYYSIHDNNVPTNQIEIVINNKKFYKASDGICMYSKPLCSGFERKFNIKNFHTYLSLYRLSQD